METLNSIFVAFLYLSLEAKVAIILLLGLLMFSVDFMGRHISSTRTPKRNRHRRARYQNNSEKEDFFDMVTRFREEIPA
ncbi:membrane protein [Gordonia phage Pherobrine]|nr:membrane protein [Gordonia phage Pherobrine]